MMCAEAPFGGGILPLNAEILPNGEPFSSHENHVPVGTDQASHGDVPASLMTQSTNPQKMRVMMATQRHQHPVPPVSSHRTRSVSANLPSGSVRSTGRMSSDDFDAKAKRNQDSGDCDDPEWIQRPPSTPIASHIPAPHAFQVGYDDSVSLPCTPPTPLVYREALDELAAQDEIADSPKKQQGTTAGGRSEGDTNGRGYSLSVPRKQTAGKSVVKNDNNDTTTTAEQDESDRFSPYERVSVSNQLLKRNLLREMELLYPWIQRILSKKVNYQSGSVSATALPSLEAYVETFKKYSDGVVIHQLVRQLTSSGRLHQSSRFTSNPKARAQYVQNIRLVIVIWQLCLFCVALFVECISIYCFVVADALWSF